MFTIKLEILKIMGSWGPLTHGFQVCPIPKWMIYLPNQAYLNWPSPIKSSCSLLLRLFEESISFRFASLKIEIVSTSPSHLVVALEEFFMIFYGYGINNNLSYVCFDLKIIISLRKKGVGENKVQSHQCNRHHRMKLLKYYVE